MRYKINRKRYLFLFIKPIAIHNLKGTHIKDQNARWFSGTRQQNDHIPFSVAGPGDRRSQQPLTLNTVKIIHNNFSKKL